MTLSELRAATPGAWLGVGFNIYGAYDLLKSSLTTQVYDPNKAASRDVDPFGSLPEYVSWRPLSIKDAFTATGETRESFQGAFAARGSVDMSVGAFTGHVELAYGHSVSESSGFSFANYSFLGVSGNLALSTDHFDRYLADEFHQGVAALPNEADPRDPHTLAIFSNFFQKFGTYFVAQVTIGASLEYYKAVSHSESLSKESLSAKAEASYKGLFVTGKASAEMKEDKEWKAYNSSSHTRIRVLGGGEKESDLLANVDVNSIDSFSPETKQKFDNWLASTATHPCPMDFKLKGIWEVCGSKAKLVEDTFREYGRLTRPLLHVETRSLQGTPDYAPGIFLNGLQVPVPHSSSPGYGGVQMVVIDRRHPDRDGVVFSKEYNITSPLTQDSYRDSYRALLADLNRYRGGEYFLVLCTFGIIDCFVPIPDLIMALKESGAGPQLNTWATSASPFGTVHIKAANYILVGIMGSGPAAGIEVFNSQHAGAAPYSAQLEVYFYSLGPGKPYVLGQAIQRLAAAV
jgi:MAC/Perforin domain